MGCCCWGCGPRAGGAKGHRERGGQSEQTEAAGRLPVGIAAGLAARGTAERKGQKRRLGQSSPGITAEWAVASQDTGRMFQLRALILHLSATPAFTLSLEPTLRLTSLTQMVTTANTFKCRHCSKHISPILRTRKLKARKFRKAGKWQS